MNSLGNYLLQMSCWLAAFWVIYTLVLKQETFFKLNRWFLNVGLVCSLIIPLFPVSYNVYQTVKPIVLNLSSDSTIEVNELHSKLNYWLLVYLTGTLFFLGRFVIQQVNLYRIRKKCASISVGSIKLYQIEKEFTPFSFYNQIYVSSNLSRNLELNTVVAHEKVHITERHWADLLLLEVVRTLQWFNPLTLLYRKAVMQNHEYLADLGTLAYGVSARTYQTVLANQMLGIPIVSFANSFAFINSGNRIQMMKKDKSTPIKRLKFLLILPLIVLIITGFARPKYVTETNTYVNITDETKRISGKVLDESGKPLPGASIVIEKSTIGTITDINGEFILDGLKPTDNIYISFVGYETKVLPVKGEKIIIEMKRKVVSIDLSKVEIAPPPPPPPPSLGFRSNDGKTPLMVLNGEIVTIDISTIDPETIKKVEILKNEQALQLYGEKGANGVICITTKSTAPEGEVFVVVEDMPQYPGGIDALKAYIQKSIANSNETGKVFVTFTIDQKGNVTNARLFNSTNEKINKKALEIINNMPKWKPGMQRGKPVKVDYTVPLEFSSTDSGSLPNPKHKGEIIAIKEQMPEFNGDLFAYIKEKTGKINATGKSIIQMTIDTDGKPGQLKVIESLSDEFVKLAPDLITNMPDWKPGILNNKPTNTVFQIDIDFDSDCLIYRYKFI